MSSPAAPTPVMSLPELPRTVDAVSPQPSWLERAAGAVRALANRPVSLFLVLLTLNALAMPYAGITHDARLYAFQVLNRMDGGAFHEDLFFAYGSQDQFSLFSPVLAPLGRLFGLETTFFVVYVLGNGLFILAMQRLLRALIADGLVSTLALFYLVATPVSFAGLDVFHINETFLTPRIFATALTLFGLERLWSRRYGTALVLLVLGCLLHPLMAIGGVLIFGGFTAVQALNRLLVSILAVVVALAGVAVLAIPSLGYAIFGKMDGEWLELVWVASPYCFPLDWTGRDWVQIAVSIAVVLAAAHRMRPNDPRLAWFLGIVALVGLVGLAASVAANVFGYRLLLQAQPYRALWLVQLLQPLLTLWLADQLRKQTPEALRFGAVLLVGSLGLALYQWPEWPLFVCAVLLGLLVVGDRSRVGVIGAVSLVAVLMGIALWREVLLVSQADQLLKLVDGWDYCRLLPLHLGPLVWIVLTVAGLIFLRGGNFGHGFQMVCAVVVLAMHLLPVLTMHSRYYLEHYARDDADIRFVAAFLNEHCPEGDQPPTIYWSNGRFDAIWLQLHACSYFAQHHQIQGSLFSRETGIEGRRRAGIVQRFEMEQVRHDQAVTPAHWLQHLQVLFQSDLQPDPPTWVDFDAVCGDTKIDYAVLPHAFDGLAAASNGRVFIYDCKYLRKMFAAGLKAGSSANSAKQASR
jgi:hypothetical protein